MWASPISGIAATFGAGAGAFAGLSTFATTDGSFSDKADAAAGSSIAYGVGGATVALGVGVAATTTSAFRAGFDKYEGSLSQSVGYGAAKNAKGIPKVGRRFASAAGDYVQGVSKEFRSPGGWKSALTRPGVSGGLGAVVGGLIGSQVSDDPAKGAVVGAAVGTGAGIAIGRAAKASQTWGKWGTSRRGGTILAASAVIGGALHLMSSHDEENVDRAEPENGGYSDPTSNVRDRLNRIGAHGDLVFGLHNKR